MSKGGGWLAVPDLLQHFCLSQSVARDVFVTQSQNGEGVGKLTSTLLLGIRSVLSSFEVLHQKGIRVKIMMRLNDTKPLET